MRSSIELLSLAAPQDAQLMITVEGGCASR
jgi:hypothetical protein